MSILNMKPDNDVTFNSFIYYTLIYGSFAACFCLPHDEIFKKERERERSSLEAFNLKGLNVLFRYCIVGDLLFRCKSIELFDREKKGIVVTLKKFVTREWNSRLLTFLLV